MVISTKIISIDLANFKRDYYLFDPKDFGRIFIFVDFGNVRPWAKNFWPEENKYRISVEIGIEKLASICNLVNPVSKFSITVIFHRKRNYWKMGIRILNTAALFLGLIKLENPDKKDTPPVKAEV